MRTMYAITHVNKHGLRTLTQANQGRNHFAIPELAALALCNFVNNGRLYEHIGETLENTTLAVSEVECYDHGDAVGVYPENVHTTLRDALAWRGLRRLCDCMIDGCSIPHASCVVCKGSGVVS